MRIGFHGLLIHPSRRGGAEAYARSLLGQLQQLDGDDEYFVLTAEDSDLELTDPRFKHLCCRVNAADPYGRVWWEQTSLAGILRKLNLDVVHFPGSTAPWSYHGPSVVTIHDTLRFQQPQKSLRLLSAYYGWNQRRIARSGKHVIAVSRHDGGIMAKRLGLGVEQWSVVPLGVDERFQPRDDVAREYLLWIGRWYPHKNLELLLQAYGLLCDALPDAPPLRLIGIDPRERVKLLQIAAEHEVRERVIVEGSIAHETLPAVLQGAKLFCFPSLVESFGLPILEALACGTPVVCSDLPAFRELYGDGVTAFGVHEEAAAVEMAEAMKNLLTDDAARQQQVTRGLEFAARYTWRACAEQTRAIYHAVATRGRHAAHE